MLREALNALVAIQELHGRDTWGRCLHCNGRDGWSIKFPCATRRLADQGLGDNLARTTKNGENNE